MIIFIYGCKYYIVYSRSINYKKKTYELRISKTYNIELNLYYTKMLETKLQFFYKKEGRLFA